MKKPCFTFSNLLGLLFDVVIDRPDYFGSHASRSHRPIDYCGSHVRRSHRQNRVSRSHRFTSYKSHVSHFHKQTRSLQAMLHALIDRPVIASHVSHSHRQTHSLLQVMFHALTDRFTSRFKFSPCFRFSQTYPLIQGVVFRVLKVTLIETGVFLNVLKDEPKYCMTYSHSHGSTY